MRRLLLFLLVFSAGLGVLLLVQSRSGSKGSSPVAPMDVGSGGFQPGSARPVEPGAGDEGSKPEPPPAPGAGSGSAAKPEPNPEESIGPLVPEVSAPLEDGGQVRPRGKISVVKFNGVGGPTLYSIAAEESRAVSEELYELLGITLELHDRETGEHQTTINAASGRVRATFDETGFEVDEDHGHVLSDVEILVHAGSELAPLRARVPELTVRLSDERLVSDEDVLIEGRGLQVTGNGLVIERDVESIRVEREPRVQLRFEDGTRAELNAAGDLMVSSLGPERARQIELVASDRARLDFTTDAQARLEAGTIRLLGQVKPVAARGPGDPDAPQEEDGRFAPQVVEALDGARLTNSDGVFEGGTGELLFAEDGSPERAVLRGTPSLRFDLGDVELGDLAELGTDPQPTQPTDPDAGLPLEAFGQGPVEVTLGSAPQLDFAGPVEVRMPTIDVTVTADAGIRGKRDEVGERLDLVISGEVLVQHGSSTLEAPELIIGSSLVEARGSAAGGEGGETAKERQRVGRLTSAGPTRTVGRLADGSRFTFATEGRLVLERDESGFFMPLAEAVDIDVRGDEPFVARAELVRDFSEQDFTMEASGDVRFASSAGEGSGETLSVLGRRRVVITGTGERPARFDFDGGWLEANQVEVDGGVLDARESVRAGVGNGSDSYRLECRWLHVDQSLEVEGDEGLVVIDALGDVVASADGVRIADGGEASSWGGEIVSNTLRIKGRPVEAPPEGAGGGDAEAAGGERAGFPTLDAVDPVELIAEGDVHYTYSAEFDISGRGERLVLRADGTGELSPGDGRRIELEGNLPSAGGGVFSMTSLNVEFAPQRLIAKAADMRLDGVSTGLRADQETGGRIRVVAGHLASDEGSILLTEGAHVSQAETEDPGWYLYAEKILLSADPDEDGNMDVESLRDMVAWGGFTASFGDDIKASGDLLQVIRESETLKIAGDPAVVEFSAFQWAAQWFELNLKTSVVKAGPGEVRGATATEESWSMSYTSIEPVEYPGETIQVIREPVIESRNEQVRASWAMFWVDNSKWSAMGRKAVGRDSTLPVPLPETGGRRAVHPQSLFGRLQSAEGADWLREIYLEGNVAYSKRGQRIARADSIYLDLIDGHGWIRRVDFSIDLPFMDEGQLKLRARWMRHSADGSFFASSAVATTCDHEEPHYVVRIGDLEIEPRTKPGEREQDRGGDKEPLEEPDGWDISTRGTSLRLYDQIEVPLPRIGVPVTPDMKVDTERLSLGGLHPIQFGSDSKLGTFIGTTVTRDLGWIAKTMHKLLTGPDAPDLQLDGKTDYRASWNNDRGVLLGFSSEFAAEDRYRFVAGIDGLFDSGDDEGLVRVPEDEREDWRAWYRARGRYNLDDDEWVEAVLSVQEDPAVQSEFFENQFLEFEERESFVTWRQAHGPDYLSGTVEAYLNDFRSEVVSQELRHARGRTAIAGVTDEIPVLYSSATSLAYIDRELGDPRYPSPFDPRFLASDGWGEQSTLRFDTSHRLETPFALGLAGLRATPFVQASGTAWQVDEEVNGLTSASSEEDPTRFSLLGGVEVGTTVWRLFESGVRHVVSPFVGYREDIVLEEDDEPLILFDETELPIDGRFFDLGVRTRLDSELSGNYVDIELVQSYADEFPDRSGGSAVSGWLPLQVNANLLAELWGIGFGVKHDARYDFEADQTPYSRTIVGFDPIENLGIELGYHSARDQAGSTLYNALSTGARYGFSNKWELEAGYVFSTQGNGRLSSEFGIRRYGHDFVFEVSTRFREGEGGGNSFQFDIIPLLAFDEPGESLVQRWKGRRY